jgi:hypothetical protein
MGLFKERGKRGMVTGRQVERRQEIVRENLKRRRIEKKRGRKKMPLV